ncbi:MAG: 50S ribosomal protein L6, partial [Pseudomonadota bacterium]|nr:50S ribosomal protein L6 [Pseudomonadota bacterium]
MSRIGKKPVTVPDGVEVTLSGQNVAAKGPKGELSVTLSDKVSVERDDTGIIVSPVDKSMKSRSL